jgi:hypothetical protein
MFHLCNLISLKSDHSFRGFMTSFELAWRMVPTPCADAWTRKQKDEARELINRSADELVAKLAFDDGSDAAALPPPITEIFSEVRVAKRAREEKAISLKARRTLRRLRGSPHKGGHS